MLILQGAWHSLPILAKACTAQGVPAHQAECVRLEQRLCSALSNCGVTASLLSYCSCRYNKVSVLSLDQACFVCCLQVQGSGSCKASAWTRLPDAVYAPHNICSSLCTSKQGPHPFWPWSGASRRRAMACTVAPPRREEQPYDLAASMRAQLLQWQCLRQPLQALRSPEHGCVGFTPCKRTLPCNAPLPAKRRKPEPAPLAAPAQGSVPAPAAVGRLKARVERSPALPGRMLGSLDSGAAGAPLRSRVLDPQSPSTGPSALAAAVLARVLPGRALATSGAAPAHRGARASALEQSTAQDAWQPMGTWSPGGSGPARGQGKPGRAGGRKPGLASGPQQPRLPPRGPPKRRGGQLPLLDARGMSGSAAAAGRGVRGMLAIGEPAGLRLKVSPGRCAAAAAKARAAKEARRPCPCRACTLQTFVELVTLLGLF